MDNSEKIEAYFAKESEFQDGIAKLRELALKTEMAENYKWGAPVYTVEGKNVLGIMAFKNHFGLWFFNGVFLTDPKKVLENAQEGKTKAMRQWKFNSTSFDSAMVLAYMNEAIENQKKGLRVMPEKRKTVKTIIPRLLRIELEKNSKSWETFNTLSPYKQRDYCEYIATAKQEKTKISRLKKIIPMINKGVGLNDKYRK